MLYLRQRSTALTDKTDSQTHLRMRVTPHGREHANDMDALSNLSLERL